MFRRDAVKQNTSSTRCALQMCILPGKACIAMAVGPNETPIIRSAKARLSSGILRNLCKFLRRMISHSTAPLANVMKTAAGVITPITTFPSIKVFSVGEEPFEFGRCLFPRPGPLCMICIIKVRLEKTSCYSVGK